MMRAFADLLDRLVLTPARNGKLRILADYFRATADPDRGYALAALTGGLDFPAVKPAMLRSLITERMDAQLFAYSYDYVGDLAETIALAWPAEPPEADTPAPTLGSVVRKLANVSRSDAPGVMGVLLDRLDPSARFALIKLATGGLRIGVSARLAKQALAALGGREVTAIEELWHGLEPPYEALFAWLEGRGGKPESNARALFRPVMLAHPLDHEETAKLEPADYAAEWKWDGIRVQAVCEAGTRRLYARSGDEISHAFPDLVDALDAEATLDGELLVGNPGGHTGSFSDLQQRLNRKTVSKRMLADFPVFMRCYDVLQTDGEDVRSLPFSERRARIEQLIPALDVARFDLSPLVPFRNWQELEEKRSTPPHPAIEGVMLKRRDAPYLAGRPKGPWFKWKRDPFIVDAVLMYAQRGHGKRSSYYSDYTFGVWKGDDERRLLVPVGKAYFGFTDEELKQIDKYVRENTVERFGPVRAVRAEPDHGLVLEIAFEGINRSTRHKSGVAMRFPRISRLRWDKPAAQADDLETLTAMLPDPER